MLLQRPSDPISGSISDHPHRHQPCRWEALVNNNHLTTSPSSFGLSVAGVFFRPTLSIFRQCGSTDLILVLHAARLMSQNVDHGRTRRSSVRRGAGISRWQRTESCESRGSFSPCHGARTPVDNKRVHIRLIHHRVTLLTCIQCCSG